MMKEEKDYLQERIAHDVEHEPGFAEVWAPYALMGGLIRERNRLGLTQREVALRMGLSQPAIARMENAPEGVALSRILAYAKVLGVEIVMKPSLEEPKNAPSPKGAASRKRAA